MLIDRRSVVAGLGVTPFLSGCVTMPDGKTAPPTVDFKSLVRQMKHDLGSYMFAHRNEAEVKLTEKACAGQVNFTIQKVKMTCTALVEHTGSTEGGLKIPINIVELEGGISRKRQLSNTITTTLNIYPISGGDDSIIEDEATKAENIVAVPPPDSEFVGTPICDALNKLRSDLISTADTPPCYNFGKEEGQENSVKWAFSVKKEATNSAKFTIAVFSVGDEKTSAITFANTIEVFFIATGEGFG